jgi:dTDP-4-amino-4,6-dideoxygalactose transaminase
MAVILPEGVNLTYLPGKDPRRAYRVVDLFEQELCDYTGAPFAIATNSCTNALTLSLMWEHRRMEDRWFKVTLPKRTYIGVLQAVLNAGFDVRWQDAEASHWYQLSPTNVVDAARWFKADLF